MDPKAVAAACERVRNMEKRYDACLKAEKKLTAALEQYTKALDGMEALTAYYDGGEWREDFEADEAGAFPPELKRGVLSEDGLYELLSADRELTLTLLKVLTDKAGRGLR